MQLGSQSLGNPGLSPPGSSSVFGMLCNAIRKRVSGALVSRCHSIDLASHSQAHYLDLISTQPFWGLRCPLLSQDEDLRRQLSRDEGKPLTWDSAARVVLLLGPIPRLWSSVGYRKRGAHGSKPSGSQGDAPSALPQASSIVSLRIQGHLCTEAGPSSTAFLFHSSILLGGRIGGFKLPLLGSFSKPRCSARAQWRLVYNSLT